MSDCQVPSSDFHEVAIAMVRSVNNDYSRLPGPVAVYLRVSGAQAVFDNGGFVYFFERDWEGQPSYMEFVDAYAAIGCTEQAAEIARVASTFGHPNPHLDEGMRQRFIAAHFDEDQQLVPCWGDLLCGDTRVMQALESFAAQNARYFVNPQSDRGSGSA